MNVIIFILTLWIFIKTFSYGLFEIKSNNNKIGGTVVIILGFVSVIFPNLVLYIK